MIHPEEQRAEEPVGRRSSILMAVILFLTIAAIAAFGYMKSQGVELGNIDIQKLFSGNNSVKQFNETSDITEIPYDSNGHPIFAIHMDYIVKCSRDGIWLLDKKGHQLWSVDVPLNNPLIKTNGKDLLVVDIGGRDVYVINGKNVRWKEKIDENIQNAEINEDGFVTVVTASRLYNGEVRVFDNRGVELMQSIIANDFAVTAKIAPSGKLMVIGLINASDVKSYTYFKFYDMNGVETAAKGMPQNEGLYPFVWFTGDDSIFAAGNNSIAYLDKDGNIKWDKQFTRIDSACVTGGKRIAVTVNSGNTSELKVFSASGQEYASAPLEGEVLNMSALGGIIAVNTGRKASFFTEKGKIVGQYTAKSDITEVLFFNKQQAAVVTKREIAIVEIK